MDINNEKISVDMSKIITTKEQEEINVKSIISDFWEVYSIVYPELENTTPYKKLLYTFTNKVKIGNNSKILDLGSGTGNVASYILSQNRYTPFQIECIDQSPKMIQHLQKRFSDENKIIIKQGNLGSPDFWIENYDKFSHIFANLVYPYIINYGDIQGDSVILELLKQSYNKLYHGGYLVWSSPTENVNFNWVFLNAIRNADQLRGGFSEIKRRSKNSIKILSHAKKIEEFGKRKYFHFLNKIDLIRYMEQSGFNDITIEKSFAKQVYIIKGRKI